MGFGEIKAIDAAHTTLLPAPCPFFCTEAESFDAVIEGLDEGDDYATAWDVPSGQTTDGFITHQGDGGSSTDRDVFRFRLTAPTRMTLKISNAPVPVKVGFWDFGGASALAERTLQAGESAELEYNFQSFSFPRTFYVRVEGSAPASSPGFGFGADACDSQAVNCRQPYKLQVGPTPASTVDLTANVTTVSLGGTVQLTATVRKANGSPVAAGTRVELTPVFSGGYTGCAITGGACVASTDAQGVARISFSTTVAGSYAFRVEAETGGSDIVIVSFATGGITATASPNPVAKDLPSTLSVTVRDGTGQTVPSGRTVTFRTTFPGFFTGNGASSPTSPSSVVTDANGQTWIRFASSSVGTANVTIESAGAAPVVLPVQIFNPNGSLQVSLSVGFLHGDEGSSTYDVRAVVTNASGGLVAGEPVTFTTSRGTLKDTRVFTGSTGIAPTQLTITSSGEVTVTATAGGNSGSTTFFGQVGIAGAPRMFPVRTLAMTTEVFGLDYTPDGSVLIVGDENGTLRAWNTSDWSLRWSAQTSDNRASQVSVSPDGTKVLMTHDDGVDIFNVSNGSLFCRVENPESKGINGTFTSNSSFFDTSFSTLYRHTSLCSAGSGAFVMPGSDDFERGGHMDYSAARGWAAAGSAEGEVYVFSSSGSLIRQEGLTAGRDDGYDVDFNGSGSRLAAVGFRIVKVFDTSNWSFTTYAAQTMGDDKIGVKFIDGDSKLAVSGIGKVEVLQVSGGATFRTGDVAGNAWELAWSEARKELAVGTGSGQVFLFRPLDPVDSQPPVISVSFPQDQHVTRETSLTATGRVTDDGTVASFTINGTAVSRDAVGSFTHTVALQPGLNTLVFRAEDAPGNVATVERRVTLLVDTTPPVIGPATLTPPGGSLGTVFALHVPVADGDTGVASVTATVRSSDGVARRTLTLIATAGGIWMAPLDSAGLVPGFYSIDLQAVDSSPAANSRTVTGATGFLLDLFGDVPRGYWAEDFIVALYSSGVTKGCTAAPLMYCPGTVVTRDQMAIFLLRGLHGSAYTPPPATGKVFTDVLANHWAASWIEQLKAEGVTSGCAPGLYCPGTGVDRAQMAVFLLRARHGAGYIPPPATGTRFTDVPASHWAASWIEQLAEEGITSGCAIGRYCPGNAVTRDQMAVFLVRTFAIPLP